MVLKYNWSDVNTSLLPWHCWRFEGCVGRLYSTPFLFAHVSRERGKFGIFWSPFKIVFLFLAFRILSYIASRSLYPNEWLAKPLCHQRNVKQEKQIKIKLTAQDRLRIMFATLSGLPKPTCTGKHVSWCKHSGPPWSLIQPEEHELRKMIVCHYNTIVLLRPFRWAVTYSRAIHLNENIHHQQQQQQQQQNRTD